MLLDCLGYKLSRKWLILFTTCPPAANIRGKKLTNQRQDLEVFKINCNYPQILNYYLQFLPERCVVSPPLLRSVNGAVNTTSTEILVLTSTSAKECYPRIHRLSLFSLPFSLLFSLALPLSLANQRR